MWQLSSRPSASVRPLVVKKPNRRQQGQTRSRILHTPSPSVAVAPSRRLREKCQRPFLRPAVVRVVRPPFPLRERARMKQPSRIARARAHFESLGRPRAVNRERMAEECGLVGLVALDCLSALRNPLSTPQSTCCSFLRNQGGN